MLTRLVKLQFHESFINEFEKSFPLIQKKVQAQNGCQEVKLFRGKDNIYFTISKWDNQDYLDLYRNSNTFKEIWALFKPNFTKKAEAWSTEEFNEQTLP